MSISGAAQVLSPEYVTFIVLVFVNALGTAGVYPLAFIIGVEMVGKKKREVTGIVLNYFYAIGEAVVAPIAWYTADWVKGPIETKDKDKDKIFPVVKEMLSSRKLAIRFIIIYFIWAVNAFIFLWTLNQLDKPRRKQICKFCPSQSDRNTRLHGCLVCGVTCTLTIFVANASSGNWAVITLFLLGKLGITSSFGVVYVYTAEMLPTIVRSGGVGTASTIARLGALLAPFVPLLGLYYTPLPMLLFGGVAILAGLLAIKLPETFGIKLPETVEEAKNI
ncbi:hypothetical protein NQ314_010436 [Rhamnusium bicolor]|uniref:Uncharacterized protein n=1 Tax=Rhamnusium bicolor TaxID=1586634 RepID=A0AAV8XQL7_9CUCU|nr:hypothetical protein NQ314_010436 [Rhamnusium bicolor]